MIKDVADQKYVSNNTYKIIRKETLETILNYVLIGAGIWVTLSGMDSAAKIYMQDKNTVHYQK